MTVKEIVELVKADKVTVYAGEEELATIEGGFLCVKEVMLLGDLKVKNFAPLNSDEIVVNVEFELTLIREAR